MQSYLVQHYLDRSAEIYPNKNVVISSEGKLSFRDLFLQSNRLANCLKHIGVSRGDRVLICLGRTYRIIVAIAAVLKTSAVYVVVDPKVPAERFYKIYEDCLPKAMICEEAVLRNMKKNTSILSSDLHVILPEAYSIDESILTTNILTINDINTFGNYTPKYESIDTDIAYILYTSGSTGDPKGVAITHLNIINYIEWAIDYFKIRKKDNILCTAPFHFDMSTFDVFCPWKSGAELRIASNSEILFTAKLIDVMKQEKITLWKGVSSLLMYIARSGILGKKTIPSLKRVIFAGDVLPTKYLVEWMKAYPDIKFYNGFGPTEATGISLCYHAKKIPENSIEPIPIGVPCANTDVVLLKDDGTVAKGDETGELIIYGSGVGRGYWNDKQKTSRAFMLNFDPKFNYEKGYLTGDICYKRNDENYIFVGRKDTQVKHMGYRIELEEIEKALLSINSIEDAAVALIEDKKYGLEHITAFIVSNDMDLKIKDSLKDKLPEYMIPQKTILVKKIPRNDRGKIDRVAVPAALSK